MPKLDPETWFGVAPGEDGVLISRACIRAWLAELEASTGRLRTQEIGTSTEGRPLDAIFIGDELSGDGLGRHARRRAGAIQALLHGRSCPPWTRPVVLITSGIHATEVGGPQSIPEIVHWLVTSESDDARAIRERLITIVVPTLNPDGMDLVHRWNETTSGTDRHGSLPPLLYHRFAGHDNNRDWLFGNLCETRVVREGIHDQWLPHVTLDQHQMNALGPRFALPPYADPWEPHIDPGIIAAASALGMSIAADLTLGGMAGVVTGRYFDAWEPSRAIQHYRGGVRILAEAANARLACPVEVTPTQLTSPPLPQDVAPSAAAPLPWHGGTWRLRDVMDYHVAAAKSMLRRISADPGMWTSLQERALSIRPDRPVTFHVPEGPPAIDVAANKRLATILDSAGLERHQDCVPGAPSWSTRQPLGGLLAATMLPKPYPVDHGASSYDVTSHFLPLYLGATVQMAAPTESTMAPTTGRFAVIDARCHRAPEAIERAGPLRCWRSPARAMAGDTLISAGSWIVDRDALDPELASLATGELGSLPRRAVPVSRRDITLLSADGQPTTDHGWTRWWLHARSIPFLEAGPALLETMYGVARSTTLVIADSAADGLRRETVNAVTRLIEEGARVVAWGRSGRRLAEAQSARVATTDFDAGGAVHAPGALLRLKLAPRTAVGLGLDAVVPAMLQRDGIFRVSGSLSDVAVLGTFAGRDTVISGWMSDSARVRDAPAILRVRRGKGELIAFSFRPLFRGQMLVTAPLVHNTLYDSPEA